MTITRGIFITGTDTGVGKTFIGTIVASALRRSGVDVGVMKPVETGCRRRSSRLWPEDASALTAAAGVTDPLDCVCPYQFREPLAPAIAASRSHRRIDVRKIVRCYQELAGLHEFMIVEGAGGILVPLTLRSSYLDLAVILKLPVVIVARPNLGTINHTLLTAAALRSRRVPVVGIVLNDARGGLWGPAEHTCSAVIKRLAQVQVLDVVRYGQRRLPGVIRTIRRSFGDDRSTVHINSPQRS